MSEKTKVRTISFLSIAAAALAMLIGVASNESGLQLSDPLAVCATTKGALCGVSGDEQNSEAIRYASIADLGQMTVSARRNADVQIASTVDSDLLGTMTITASRLPSDRLAQAPSASGHSF